VEPIKPDSFYDVLFRFVGGSESFRPEVYDDGKGIPTIGYGTALIIKVKGRWTVLRQLEERLQAAGVPLDIDRLKDDYKKLGEISEALNEGERENARAIINVYQFSIKVDEPQARKLYDIGMDWDHLSIVRSRLDREGTKRKRKPGKAGTYAKLTGTRELIALADISYNGPVYLTDELIGYVVAGERQKAFYHMAYKMRSRENLDKYPGYVPRSYKDAHMYGYYAGDKPTREEIKALEEIYAKDKETIDAYDKKWGGKLKKEVKGWVPFAELIQSAKQGKVVAWAPPAPYEKGTSMPGVSAEQIALMAEFCIPGARPQPLGVSAYEQIMMIYSGGGSDAPLKNVCDPNESIKRRYGGN
jgi:hypothetical protein